MVVMQIYFHSRLSRAQRKDKISRNDERVLIIGASSGVGREIALQYAARGAKVCVVGRREGILETIAEECRNIRHGDGIVESIPGAPSHYGSDGSILSLSGDCSNVDHLIALKNLIVSRQYAIVEALAKLTFLAWFHQNGMVSTPSSSLPVF
jgi:NAD(P)-dependent dehydrogenase (short-subunit alcohol dehydrogenase family)